MIKITKIFLLLIICFSYGCSGGGTSGSGGIEIKGTTIDQNSKPVANVQIDIVDLNNNPIASSTTSFDGKFKFVNLPQREGKVVAKFPSVNRKAAINYAVPSDRSLAIVTFRKRKDGSINSSIRYRSSKDDNSDNDNDNDNDDDNGSDEPRDDDNEDPDDDSGDNDDEDNDDSDQDDGDDEGNDDG